MTATVITTDFKEGGECQQLAVAAGFTTGKAAYLPITSLDLSAKQQVSFWIKQTAGTIGAASATYVALCSDAVGATPVHTMNIPALGALNQWTQISFDNAANLNAAIQSVAFYVVTDNGAQTFLLDNITASKAASSADSIKLSSLISKNSGDEVWYGLQSINGTRLMLDRITNTIPANSPQRGYSGTTETVTTYKRETTKNSVGGNTQEAGTAGSPITYSGGWNRTDMSTQTGETWYDATNGLGTNISIDTAYVAIDKINAVRGASGIGVNATQVTIGSALSCNCTTGIAVSSANMSATTLAAVGCDSGIIGSGASANITTVTNASGCLNDGIGISGMNAIIGGELQDLPGVRGRRPGQRRFGAAGAGHQPERPAAGRARARQHGDRARWRLREVGPQLEQPDEPLVVKVGQPGAQRDARRVVGHC